MFSDGPEKGKKILEDLGQLAGGVASMASGLGRQVKEEIRARVDEIILKMDFVPRSEFERLEAMVQKLRTEQEKMAEQLKAKKKS